MKNLWILTLLIVTQVSVARHGHQPVKGPLGPGHDAHSSTAPEIILTGDIKTSVTFVQNVRVRATTTVVVNAGVKITLANGANLTVDGTLKLRGGASLPVTIIGGGAAAGGSVIFEKDSTGEFAHVVLKNIGHSSGAVQILGKAAIVSMDSVAFENIHSNGVVVTGGQLSKLEKCTFKSVKGICVLLYGAVGDLSVTGTRFQSCRSNAILTDWFPGQLTVEKSEFHENGMYALHLGGDGKFSIKTNVFRKNKGVFACRYHTTRENRVLHPWSEVVVSGNDMSDNAVDGSSDGWSRGNLMYVHGCAAQISNNIITKTMKYKTAQNLINFYDSHVQFYNNSVTSNPSFAFTVNVGGPQTFLHIKGNYFENVLDSGAFEVANEAHGVTVDAKRNWWGCNKTECILKKIKDFHNGGDGFGVVQTNPPLPSKDRTLVVADPNQRDSPGDLWDDDFDFDPLHDDKVKYIVSKEDAWTQSKNLTQSVWIKKTGVLTIAPADSHSEIVILLGPNVNIHVEGALQLRGSTSHPIRFAPLDPSKPWGTITFSHEAAASDGAFQQGSYIMHAILEGGGNNQKSSSSNRGLLSIASKFLTVAHTVFKASASSGVVVRRSAPTLLRIFNCTFTTNKGNGIAFHGNNWMVVEKSAFLHNQQFGIMLSKGFYNVTGSFFHHNSGVLCSQRRPTPQNGPSEAMPQLFEHNHVAFNSFLSAFDCWGDPASDIYKLVALGSAPVVLQGNTLSENHGGVKAVRARARMDLITGDYVLKMVDSSVISNDGHITLASTAPPSQSWEHPPVPFVFAANTMNYNVFFRCHLTVVRRQGIVASNRMERNEVTDDSSLHALPVFQISGGSFDRKPLNFTANHIMGNEGTLVAVRISDKCWARSNWFENPFVQYELDFTGNPLMLLGYLNYWGDFSASQETAVKKRIKPPSSGEIPSRWYGNWILKDGSPSLSAQGSSPTPAGGGGNTALSVFVGGVLLGFLAVLGVLLALLFRTPSSPSSPSYAVLDLEDRPSRD